VFEPGSTIKPFTLSLALAKGVFTPDSRIMTGPGVHYVGGRRIKDVRDYGDLSFSEVLIKSSNIGAAKVALEMAPKELYDTLSAVGFGHTTGIELPGEQSGLLLNRERPVDHAWLSFGYGLSATIWTENKERAARVSNQVEAGVIWVNCWMIRDLRTPFGGMKQSGVGREGGSDALRFFTEPKNICTSSA
jgi:hypothetical protein